MITKFKKKTFEQEDHFPLEKRYQVRHTLKNFEKHYKPTKNWSSLIGAVRYKKQLFFLIIIDSVLLFGSTFALRYLTDILERNQKQGKTNQIDFLI